MANKNILLIEPGYKNKYPPLGLMKLAAYHGPHGKKDKITFIKGEANKSVFNVAWDRIYITTLFSFEWKTIEKSIDFAVEVSRHRPNIIFVGGIAASLMTEKFVEVTKWRGIRFIKGLLSEPPAMALQLDDFAEEMYSDDISGLPIEDLIPDYDILSQIQDEYVYPVNDAYFAYASRGCVRKCHFCGVPKLEGAQRDAQPITAVVNGINERFGPKKDLMLMDNNIVASGNFANIMAEIRDLGFTPGATLKRGRQPVQRRVDFNQGVDARILCKDKMYLREMSTICLKPLRIAFDHIGVRKPYETAIRYAHEYGLHELSNYMLYNFHDTPEDLYQRMRLNIDLNVELGIRIFSFPMRFQPTDMKDRTHVGAKWTKYQLRSMQIILQATHGIVSGSPSFFMRAFGDGADEFQHLLARPQHFLFNRSWYDEFGGRAEFEEFDGQFRRLSDTARQELLGLLSGVGPSEFHTLRAKATMDEVRSILPFYVPPSKIVETGIWDTMKTMKKPTYETIPTIPADELVEDANLAEIV